MNRGYGFVRKLITPTIFLLSLVSTNFAFAAAGDAIRNTASVEYVYQAINFTLESSPTGNTTTGVGNGTATSFTEDRLINFSVAERDGITTVVSAGQLGAVLVFTVTNNGNAVQDFLLTAVNTSPNPFGGLPDGFDPNAPMRVFVDSSLVAAGGDSYASGVDTGVFIDELAPGVSRTVYVVADIPAAAAATEIAAVALVAQVAAGGAAGQGAAISNDDNGNVSAAGSYSNGGTNVAAGTPNNVADTTGVEVVFNDPAGVNPEDADSTGAVTDIVANGQHSDTSAYEVSGSPVTITKSVTVIDTLGGTDPHPGATLRYQLVVNIVGAGNVNNLIITDPIPANTTSVDNSIVIDGVPQTDVQDAVDYAERTGVKGNIIIDYTRNAPVPRIVTAADSPITITFDVTID